jgi:hypothetical protein
VFVAGGEYGSGRATAEIYDPASDSWASINPPTSLLNPAVHSPVLADPGPGGNQGFIDSDSIVIANGSVLVSPVGPNTYGGTLIYNPFANMWSAGPSTFSVYQDEASWVKLPDDSILTIDPLNGGANTERYIPASNSWIHDTSAPVGMYSGNQEIGAALLLADGRAFYLGGNGHTAYYTPSGNTSPGSWTQGPDIPNGNVTQDAPAAMMVNGKILCAVTSSSSHQPVYFYEFDPVANSFNTSVPSPTGGAGDNTSISDATSLLDLPDGTVLWCNTSSRLYVYQPDGFPLAAGQPVITGISLNPNGSFHLTGTGLNGISAGAAYGDDAQEDSNFPLVRITDGGGNVSYARTFNWSSTSVTTGGATLSTEFTVPPGLVPGNYSLQVVANGNASAAWGFSSPAWLDFNYFGFFEFGDYYFPYKTLAHAVAGVPNYGTILIKTAGSSAETMTITKPMTLSAVGGPATVGN